MTNKEFANICIELSKTNSVYMNGTYCQQATTSLLNSCAKRLPNFYTADRIAKIKPSLDKGYIAADCVGLIKGILWGFPSVKYATNGQADVNDAGLVAMCKDVSKDFKNIQVGEIVHMSGHVGVYVGNGQVVECTTKWTNNILVSNLGNLGYTTGHYRIWTDHGKHPLISYGADNSQSQTSGTKSALENVKDLQRALNDSYGCKLAIDGSCGALTQAEIKKHYLFYNKAGVKKNNHVKWLQSNLKNKGYNIAIDSSYGPATRDTVKAYQKTAGLKVDGYAGLATIQSLI